MQAIGEIQSGNGSAFFKKIRGIATAEQERWKYMRRRPRLILILAALLMVSPIVNVAYFLYSHPVFSINNFWGYLNLYEKGFLIAQFLTGLGLLSGRPIGYLFSVLFFVSLIPYNLFAYWKNPGLYNVWMIGISIAAGCVLFALSRKNIHAAYLTYRPWRFGKRYFPVNLRARVYEIEGKVRDISKFGCFVEGDFKDDTLYTGEIEILTIERSPDLAISVEAVINRITSEGAAFSFYNTDTSIQKRIMDLIQGRDKNV